MTEKGFRIVGTEGPTCWRLAQNDEDGDPEEAVFILHGVIYQKRMPPLKART
jgi:hypothetical protein